MSISITALAFGQNQPEDDLITIGMLNKHVPADDIKNIYKSQNVISIFKKDNTYKGVFISRMLANGLTTDIDGITGILPVDFTYKNIQLDNSLLPDMDPDETFLESIQDLEFRDAETNQVYDGIISLLKSKEYSALPPVVFNNSLFNLVFIMYIINNIKPDDFNLSYGITPYLSKDNMYFPYKGLVTLHYVPYINSYFIKVIAQIDIDTPQIDIYTPGHGHGYYVKGLVQLGEYLDVDQKDLDSIMSNVYKTTLEITQRDLDMLLAESNQSAKLISLIGDKLKEEIKYNI